MVEAPSLSKLKTRPCSPEELQAALVKLIELHNTMEAKLNLMVEQGRISTSQQATMRREFTL